MWVLSSMCGWMYKLSLGLQHSKWVRRFLILVDFRLTCYESPLDIANEKGVILCDDVRRINYDADYIEIYYGDGEKDFWALRSVEEESPQIQRMWLRKLLRCCPTGSHPEARVGAVSSAHRSGEVRASHRAPPLRVACGNLSREAGGDTQEAKKIVRGGVNEERKVV